MGGYRGSKDEKGIVFVLGSLYFSFFKSYKGVEVKDSWSLELEEKIFS